MPMPNWPDSITKVYRHVPLECLSRLKSEAKHHETISIRAVPMPGSRDTFRVSIKSAGHSWVASSDHLADFYCALNQDDRLTLSCLYEMGAK